MLLYHTFLAIESFTVNNDRPGAFDDEVVIEGWFATAAEVTAMHLVFPKGAEIEITNRRIESSGVFEHHGDKFGDGAKRCRFRLFEPIGHRTLDFQQAQLRIVVDQRLTLSLAIGTEFRQTARREFAQEDRELVMRFESLGDMCEFGLVQRRVGVERLGLLRYAGVGDIELLATSIESRFGAMERPDAVQVRPHEHEWMAYVPSAHLMLHTGRNISDIDGEMMRRAEASKLRFLAQKLIDDFEEASKIFVYRVLRDERGGPDGTRGMDRLYDVMQAIGPVRMLWINEADERHPHATVEHVRGGLYRGWISHLAPHSNAFNYHAQAWIELLWVAERVITARNDLAGGNLEMGEG